MENKNLIASVGLKKIRTAQILQIIAVVLATIGTLVMLSGSVLATGGAMEKNEALAVGGLGAAGAGSLLAVAGLVIGTIAFIMQIVGLYKARPAHAGYKTALYMILANIVLGFVSFFVRDNMIASSIFQALSPIVVFLAVYFVISATIALLREKGDEVSAAKGLTVRTIYLTCTAISVVSELLLAFPTLASIIRLPNITTMISSVFQIIAIFMYVGFLGRSVRTLSE